MAWGKLVWGRDLRARTWELPPVIDNLPLTLKRTGLYPRHQSELALAAQNYLNDPAPQRPHYAPQAAGRAGQWAQPAVEASSYVASPYLAVQSGNAMAQRLSTPRVVINPERWAAAQRTGQFPTIQGRDSASISADLLAARGQLSASDLAAYGQQEAERAGYARLSQAQRMAVAQQAAAVAAAYTTPPALSGVRRRR